MNKVLTFLLLLLNLHSSIANTHFSLLNSYSSSRTYNQGDQFSNNLSKLMFFLLQETPNIGFGLKSIGHGNEGVFGLAMCRGDIPSSTCTSCIHEANDHILHHCPFKKEATIWLDHCLVRYADREFFGEIDDGHKSCVRENKIVSKMTFLEANKVEELMRKLVKKAYLTPLLFASGDIDLGEKGKLFGLVQCTRDLSGGDCKRCLDSAIVELQSCNHGGKGGNFVGGSCNLRYELYPFYDSS